MSYMATSYETALWSWLDAAVGGDVDDIRYANQPFAVGGKTVVTLQVLQVTQEMTPSRRLTVIDRREEIESAYTGTVSVQVFGPNHRAIAQTIVRSLWRDDIGRTNTANGVEVRGEVGGIQDLSALIATDYLARSGVDFTFSFREIWTADEASAAITAAAATGMGDTVLVEQFKRIAAALRGESTVTVGASVSMAASATIEGASTVSAGAMVRVPVAAQCVGASNVTVGAMARRISEATCAGASTVLAGAMVRRLAKASPIIGASGVVARASIIPAALSDAVVWVDLGAISTLYQDTACTLPVAALGDPINGVRHPRAGAIAMESRGYAPPIWGGPEVGAVFSGNSRLYSLAAFDAPLLYSCVRLVREAGGSSSEHPVDIYKGSVGSPVGRSVLRSGLGSTFFRTEGGAQPPTQPMVSVPIGAPASVCWELDAVSVSTALNGVETDRVSWMSGGLGTGFTACVGGEPFATNNRFVGSIQKLAVFNRTLTAPERMAIETYMGA